MANAMLNTAAHSGHVTRNSRYIAFAEEGAEELQALIEGALAQGELDMAGLFDTAYRPLPGSEPTRYENGFTALDNRFVQPLLERRPEMGREWCGEGV